MDSADIWVICVLITATAVCVVYFVYRSFILLLRTLESEMRTLHAKLDRLLVQRKDPTVF